MSDSYFGFECDSCEDWALYLLICITHFILYFEISLDFARLLLDTRFMVPRDLSFAPAILYLLLRLTVLVDINVKVLNWTSLRA